MFDNYYFEALILKRHSLRKVELLQLIDELMQRKSDIYNQLKIKEKQLERLEKQLEIAVKALEIYADKTNWDNHFTIEINNCEIEVITFIEGTDKDGEFYAEKALQQIKELEK